jgi:HK97 family phage major capsid protein
MPKVAEVKEKRNKLVALARATVDDAEKTALASADGEFRGLGSEDKAKVDKILADVSDLDELIERLQAVEKMEGASDPDSDEEERDEDDDGEAYSKRSIGKKKGHGRRGRRMSAEGDPEYRARHSRGSVYDDPRDRMLASPEYRSAFGRWVRDGYFDAGPEYRDVTMSPNSAGGYLTTPTQISKDVVQIVNNLVYLRQIAKKETVKTAQSLGVRQITTQPSDAAWTTEIGITTPDSSLAFGRRDLFPNLISKLITVSLRLLQTAPDAVPLVNERLAYKFAIAEENAFFNGTGTGQPLGVFTPSSNGIPTSQDTVVSTSGATTTLSADLLIGAKYSLKQPYLTGPSVCWFFSRPVIQQVRLLKDLYGRYLWVDGGGLASAPDTLEGLPVKISEYAPAALTSGSYVGILGNFSYYQICDVEEMQIQRLVELYAGTHEMGFMGRRWLDASPVLGEAFTRLILHS